MNVLAPSILSADFGQLGAQLQAIKDGGAQCVHFDVMDGHFVPEISFGEPILRSVRGLTDLLLDVHLMVYNPKDHIEAVAKGGADIFTFHYEVMPGGSGAYGGIHEPEMARQEAMALIGQIHAAGMKAGISIKPKTKVADIIPYLPMIDLVLVMSVEPGFGGQEFMPQALKKIAELKILY